MRSRVARACGIVLRRRRRRQHNDRGATAIPARHRPARFGTPRGRPVVTPAPPPAPTCRCRLGESTRCPPTRSSTPSTPTSARSPTRCAGPVCVLAGAGTGKTRAITHRIAYGVRTGVYTPTTVLAVTFTARAAGEMRTRLRDLGVAGVQARTFHAAALRQLGFFWPQVVGGAPPRILEHKAPAVADAAGRLWLSRRPARDPRPRRRGRVGQGLARHRGRLRPGRRPPSTAPRRPGFDRADGRPAHLGLRGRQDRARRHRLRGRPAHARRHAEHAAATSPTTVRGQYRLFVVDEYQDVSPLQQFLLDQWLGGRDELCVVGDPSQTIYSFTGATPHHLLDFPATHPGAQVIRLVRDYRSTPAGGRPRQPAASRSAAAGGTPALELVAQRPAGPAGRLHRLRRRRVGGGRHRRPGSVGCSGRAPGPARSPCSTAPTPSPRRSSRRSPTAGVGYLVRGGERFFARSEVREAIVLLRGAGRSADAESADARGQVRDVLLTAGWSRAAARRPGVPPASAGSRCRRSSRSPTTSPPRRRRRRLVDLRRRARRARRRAARPDGRGRHAGVAARRQGPGVGRGLPRGAERGAHADLARGDRGGRGGGAAAALRGRHPGPRAPGAVATRARGTRAAGPRAGARGSSTGCGPRTARGRRRGTGTRRPAPLLTGEYDAGLFERLMRLAARRSPSETDKPAYTVLVDAALAAIAETRPSSHGRPRPGQGHRPGRSSTASGRPCSRSCRGTGRPGAGRRWTAAARDHPNPP